MNPISRIIIRTLFVDEAYATKVSPFLHVDYFREASEKTLFAVVAGYIEKYRKLPTSEEIRCDLHKLKIADGVFKGCIEIADWIDKTKSEKINFDWVVNESEKFVKDEAIYIAMKRALSIMSNSDTKEPLTKEAIPDLLSKALGISFDSSVGHNYFDDYQKRYDFYHNLELKIPFDLEYMNKITNGGVAEQSLNIILAGVNVGKSLFLCHHAAHCLNIGKNVLYITAEMPEEQIGQRIDANLLDVEIANLPLLTEDDYRNKILHARKRTAGTLVIKQYPTGTAHVGHVRQLLNELQLKQGFKPHIIFVDYLNIMLPLRAKFGGDANSYGYLKMIAEEFRGLAMEKKVTIWSAGQFNRGGMDSSDPSMTQTGDSMGLPATADFMIAAVTSEELAKQGQFMFKQLKNRFGDNQETVRFIVGVDKKKMRLFDVDPSSQKQIMKSPGAKKAALEMDDEASLSSPATVKKYNGEKPKDTESFGSGWK